MTEASQPSEVGPTPPEAAPSDAATPPSPIETDEPLMTEAPPAVVEQVDKPGVDRTTDRRLARLHLRTGARALARVELESLAGAGGLDDEALLDLAEVRWRTDDLTGAGEAAAAYLASGREAGLALVIVAEATAALGRPSEARRLARRAVELIDGPLDPVFAGMPRSDVWPAQPAERVEVAGAEDVGPRDAQAPTLGLLASASSTSATGADAASSPSAAGLVAMAGVASTRTDSGRPGGPMSETDAMPDPAAELAAARAAIAAGDRAEAAIRLAVVLRLAPALAPVVLDIAAGEPGPGFDLVRGDALRLVGRESQARRSFASAARGSAPVERNPGPEPESGPTPDPEPDPEPDAANDTESGPASDPEH